MAPYDLAIIGGGIVGLATAYQFTRRYPGRRVIVLEKEKSVAAHQTGHNSGVLHSGIYYRPGSLRAQNCQVGKRLLEAFCSIEGIPYEICGKVIVAVNESELPALQMIYERGGANGIDCTIIGRERLSELEPHAAGIQAIHVPSTGIIDYRRVAERLAERICSTGGSVLLNAHVTKLNQTSDEINIVSAAGDCSARLLVTCGGLHSDRVTKLTGADPGCQIVPFRGEYFELKPDARHLCRNLIYPVPDPQFPFLGVHFTKMIAGGVECGPNAVLAFGRESYRFWQINARDLLGTLSYRGFRRLALKHWRTGLHEVWRSLSKRAFVRTLQRLIPAIRAQDLESAPAGVRAQAVTPDGNLVDDFLIADGDRVINVCNAPSPAATAALQIGVLLVDRIAQRMKSCQIT